MHVFDTAVKSIFLSVLLIACGGLFASAHAQQATQVGESARAYLGKPTPTQPDLATNVFEVENILNEPIDEADIITMKVHDEFGTPVAGSAWMPYTLIGLGTYTNINGSNGIKAPSQYGVKDDRFIGLQSNGGKIKVELEQDATYLGMAWPAGDAGNLVEFYKDGEKLFEYKTDNITKFLDGGNASIEAGDGSIYNADDYYGQPGTGAARSDRQNRGEPYAYVHFVATEGLAFDEVRFSQTTGGGFETDNHSVYYGATPKIPEAWVDIDQASSVTLTGPPSVNQNEVSEKLTLTVEDALGNEAAVGEATTFNLSTSDSGTFYENADGTGATTSVTLAAGESTATLYYESGGSATHTLEATENGGTSNPALQGETDSHDVNVISDTDAPTTLTLDTPSSMTIRQPGQTLAVGYSYTEPNPDTTTITFDDGAGNTATYGVDDALYVGDNSTKTVTLDLSSPKTSAGNGLVDGSTYDIAVQTTDWADNSTSTTGANLLRMDGSAPPPPTLTATAGPGGGIDLSWTDVNEGTTTYSLRRSTTPGSGYTEITTAPDDGGGYSYTDTGVTEGTAYYYVVVPIDGAGNEGAPSNEGAATADATGPTVTITNPADGATLTSPQGTIDGTSSDNVQVDGVALTIQRSDGQYWTGTGWASGTTTVAATAVNGAFDTDSENWTYDASGITGDDTYDVTAEAVDIAGNASSPAALSYTIEATAPEIASGTLAGDNSVVDLTFSEAAYTNGGGSGALTAGDLTIAGFSANGGAATGVSITGLTTTDGSALAGGETVVRVQISAADGPASGSETFEVRPADGSSIFDGAGNAMANTETTGPLTLNDRRAPGALSIDGPASPRVRASTADNNGRTTLAVDYSYTESSPASATITLDDGSGNTATYTVDDSGYAGDGSARTASLNLTAPDATTGNGLVDGTSYDVQVQATDDEGNSNSTSTGGLLTIDNTAPSLASATVDGDAVTLAYDETLDGGSVPATGDLSVTVNGSAASLASVGVAGDEVSITLDAAVSAGDNVALDYTVGSAPVQDDGSENDAAPLGGQSVTNETPDTTPPTITNVTGPADGTYGVGDVLTVTADYDEAVIVDEGGGTPSIELDVGGTTRQATYDAGSGTPSLTFTYALQAGDDDSDGIGFATTVIQQNGGTLQDAAGNDADRDFSGGAPDLSGVQTDGTAPVVSSITRSAPTAEETNQTSVVFAVSFSESVDQIDTGDFAMSGPAGGTISNVSAASGSAVTVTVGSITGNGTLGLDVAGGTDIRDGAGNTLDAGEPSTDETYTIDTTAPTGYAVSWTTAPINGGNATAADFEVSGGAAGLDYDYTITTDGGSGEVTGSGTMGGPTETITEDVSALADGTLTVEVTLTDGSGNTGSPVTDNVLKDTSAPSTVAVTSPSDGATVEPGPTIEGSASDDNTVSAVALTVQRPSDGKYWDGGSWVSSSTTVSTGASDGSFDSGSENWTYDASGITGADTYSVTATATDGVGNEASSSASSFTISKPAQIALTGPASVTAGQTSSNFTLTIQDSDGNPTAVTAETEFDLSSTSGGTVTYSADPVTVPAGNSSVTFTYEGTEAGSQTVTASASSPADGGLSGDSDNASITVNPAAADETTSTIAAADPSIAADGTSTTTITAQLKDRFGNDLSSGGDNAGLSTDAGSLSAVTDNGDGTYEATLTSSTNVETATVTGTVNSSAISDDATLDFVPGAAASVAIATISSPQTAGQAFSVDLTVQDANGNTVTGYSGTLNLTLAKGSSIGPTSVSISGSDNGTKTVSVTLSGAVTDDQITATDDNDGSINGTSNTFDVKAGTATTVTVATEPATTTAGESIAGPPTATVTDANGNPVSGVDVTVAESGGYAFDSGSETVSTDGSGQATFSDLVINTADTGYQIDFAIDGADAGVSSSDNAQSAQFEVTAGSATALAYGQQPTDAAAGDAIAPSVEVRIEDAYGNLVTSATDDVTIALGTDPTNGSATLNGTLTQGATSGVATFGDLSVDEAASGYTLSATNSSLSSAESNAFEVTTGSAATLAITGGDGQSAAVTSTLPSGLEVKVTDSEGNPVSGQTVTFSITSTPSGASGASLSSTSETTDGSGLASVDLTLGDKTGTYEVTASSGGLSDVVFSATATAGSAAEFVLSGSSSMTAGTVNDLTITAQDAYGNTATGYTGEKALTFSGASTAPDGTVPTVTDKDGTAVEFGTGTAITFADGQATVSSGTNGPMTLYATETASIGVTDGTISEASPLDVTVTAGSLDRFAWGLDSPQTNREAFTGTNTLSAEDAWGNVVAGFDASTENVTIATNGGLSSGAVTGLGSGGTNVLDQAGDFTNGVADLSSLGMIYEGPVGDGTFTATAGSGPSGTSGTVTIEAGAPAQLAYAAGPTDTEAGATLSGAVVEVQDADGNVVTTDPDGTTVETVTVGFATSTTATLSGTTTRDVDWSAGQATFDDLSIDETGTYQFEANTSLSAPGPVTSASFDITAGTATTLTINGGDGQSGEVMSTLSNGLEVKVTDAEGNPVSGQTVTFSVTTEPSGASGASLSSSSTTTDANGLASVDLTLGDKTSTYQVTASSSGLSDVVFNASATAAAASQLAFTTQPTDATAGQTMSDVVVQLRDQYGNNVSRSGIDVALAISDGATLNGTTPVSTDGSGQATFSDLSVEQARTGYTLTASNAGLTDATSDPFAITPGAAASVAIATISSPQTVGQAFSVDLTVQDANGNTVTGYSGTLDLTLAKGASISPTSVSVSGSDNGTKTVSVTLSDAVTDEQITATDDTDGSISGTSNPFDVSNDTTPPEDLTLDDPGTTVVRALGTNAGPTDLEVVYSYTEDNPDAATIRLDDGAGNTAAYTVDDSGYPGDNTARPVTLDLTAPDTEAGEGLQDGVTYDLVVEATDTQDNTAQDRGADRVEIDDAAPQPGSLLEVNTVVFNGLSTDSLYSKPPSATLNSLGAMTLEMWLWPGSLPDAYLLAEKAGADPENSQFRVTGSGNTLRVELYVGTDTVRLATDEFFQRDASTASTAAKDGSPAYEWAHLAVAVGGDGETASLYRNGTLLDRAPMPGAMNGGSAPLNVGTRYDGEVHEIRVWSTSRSQAQIQSLLTRTLDDDTPNLVEYHRFENEDQDFDVARDRTANDNDLFLSSSVEREFRTLGVPRPQMPEDSEYIISFKGEDKDGGPVTARITSTPAEGTLYQMTDGDTVPAAEITGPVAVSDPNSRVFYRPNPDYNGPDQFDYVLRDETGNQTAATTEMTVTPVNDAPRLSASEGDPFSFEGTTRIDITQFTTDVDHNDDELEWTATAIIEGLEAEVDNPNKELVLRSTENFLVNNSQAPVQITVRDPAKAQAVDTLRVNPKTLSVDYEMGPNYPNPAVGNTTIEYAVPEPSDVTIQLFDLLGRRVTTLVDGTVRRGVHTLQMNVDRRGLASGTYFYRMNAESRSSSRQFRELRRMVIVK